MYPDFDNARIGGKPATAVITDGAWFRDSFIPTVQQRGAAIIKARGLSSAASAANAVVDTVRALTSPTKPGDWFSAAVCSPGSQYGIAAGLVYSFPVRSEGGKPEIVPGLPLTEFARSKIVATENELKEEKAMVAELL
jgi:malate dehydrogenase